MRRHLSLLLAGAMMASPLLAQNATVQPKYPLDVAITYSAAMSNATTTDRFWMQGGSAQLHSELYRGLGVVAEVSGAHTGSINSSGVGLDIVTATFGPRYTWSPVHSRYSIFGQALVGEANGFSSVFPTVRGANDSSNSLAVQAGGGVNFVAVAAYGAPRLRRKLDADPVPQRHNQRAELSAARRRSRPPVPIRIPSTSVHLTVAPQTTTIYLPGAMNSGTRAYCGPRLRGIVGMKKHLQALCAVAVLVRIPKLFNLRTDPFERLNKLPDRGTICVPKCGLL
jgi:hypothetical protein